MNSFEYHRLQTRNDVMLRPYIRATLTRLEAARPDLAVELHRLLSSQPVDKPARHEGGAETDYLRLEVSSEFIEDVVEELGTLESQLVQAGRPRDEINVAGDLLDRWNRAEPSRR